MNTKAMKAMKAMKVRPHKARENSYGSDYVSVSNAVTDDEPQPKKKRGATAGKAAKDPNKPKKGLSAYMFFSTETRPKVKSDNPDIKFGDIAKEIANQWRELSDEQKKKYEALAANDKKRYEKDMAAYNKTGNTSGRV